MTLSSKLVGELVDRNVKAGTILDCWKNVISEIRWKFHIMFSVWREFNTRDILMNNYEE